MSRYRVALAAAVCILGMLGSDARAQDPPDGPDNDVVFPPQKQRRPVAVIELGDFKGNRDLAGAIAVVLNNHEDLKPIDDAIAPAILVESFVDEDADRIGGAINAKQDAEGHIATYNFPTAASSAGNGLEALLWVTPTKQVVALYAELSFILGAARLGQKDVKGANEAFRLARTVEPTFKPDAIRYLPEIIQAFETAVRTAPTGKGKISVTGEGRVFLDGREVGSSPQWFDAAPGAHIVWLVGPDREPRAKRVVVIAEQKEEAAVDPAPLPRGKLIRRARLALKAAPDPAARAAAMQSLAKLLGFDDALLLSEANGKTIIQTWRAQAPGFSALREYKTDDKPDDLLEPFLPPKIVIPPRPFKPIRPPIVVDARAWYEKPRYQIAGGVAGAVAIGVVIYLLSSWERSLFSDEDGSFEMRRP